MPGPRVVLKNQSASVKDARRNGEEWGGRLDNLRMRVTALQEKASAADAERKALRQIITQQGEQINQLKRQMKMIMRRGNDLKTMLATASAQRDELSAALSALEAKASNIDGNRSPVSAVETEAYDRVRQYQKLVHRIREIVRNSLPGKASVVVASKGD